MKKKPINLLKLSKKQLKEISKLKLQKDSSINTNDIPEATDSELKTGHFYYQFPKNIIKQ